MKTTALLLALACGHAAAADHPASIPLWPGKPPQFLEGAPPERLDETGHIKNLTVASLTVFPAPKDKATGQALIIAGRPRVAPGAQGAARGELRRR